MYFKKNHDTLQASCLEKIIIQNLETSGFEKEKRLQIRTGNRTYICIYMLLFDITHIMYLYISMLFLRAYI